MKTKRFFLMAATFVAGMAAMISCENNIEPEKQEVVEGPVLLTAEGFTSSTATKTSVSGSTVQWENGDVVNLNGVDYSITVNGDRSFVDAPLIAGDPVYGYYGCTATNGQTTTPSVTIPASYAFSLNSDGDQVISLPMAAYSASASSTIVFKHLSAAVNITIWNATGSTLYIDAVTVTADEYRLNGDCALNLTAANFGITPDNASVPEANRSVTITFATPLEIAKGQENAKSIQVPIMPIGADNLTIHVDSHNADIAGVPVNGLTHVFNHTAASAALGRNVMVSAKVKISPISATVTSKGTFSISDTEAIYFSKGNLQATTADYGATWSWSFAPTQLSYIGAVDANSNPTANTFYVADPNYNNNISWFDNTKNGTVDLFVWVSAGGKYNDNYPDLTGGAAYGIFGATDDWYCGGPQNALARDWGDNIGDGWFTLSKDQWKYLLDTRGNEGKAPTTHYQVDQGTAGVQDRPARWFKATVADVKCMVLIPDDFSWPESVEMKDGFINKDGYAYPVLNNQNSSYGYIITAAEWPAFEEAGCVILPPAGRRVNDVVENSSEWGYYWTSSFGDGNVYDPYCVYHTSSGYGVLSHSAYAYQRYGLAVRLAHPAN